jgi:hypothetical protein
MTRNRRQLVALAIGLVIALAVFLLWPEPKNAEPQPIATRSTPTAPTTAPIAIPDAVPPVVDAGPPALPRPQVRGGAFGGEDDDQTGTVPNGRKEFSRTFHARMENQAQQPVSHATLSVWKSEHERLTLCTSDGNGHCDFTTTADCETCVLTFQAGAPGFGRAMVAFGGPDPVVTLLPARTVTVVVTAPSDALVAPLWLRLTSEDPPLWTTVAVDHAGTYVVDALPRAPIEVALMDDKRPLKLAVLPVEVDTTTFALTPRRLDVQVEVAATLDGHSCASIDLRCPGTTRLLQHVDVIGAHVLHARFEYAPAGPCTVALSASCDEGITTDPDATLSGVMPPTAVVIHRGR